MEELKFKTIYDLIKHIETNYSSKQAFNFYDNNVWHSLSTEEFIYDLKRLTYGLISLGVKKGDHVGIMASPSPNWSMADLAIIMAGGITVPLFSNISDENFIYEVAQADVRYLFVDGTEQQEMFRRHRNLFDYVIALSHRQVIRGTQELHEVQKIGEAYWRERPELFETLGNQLKTDETMTIVYTSGSTGVPKGVMLSHENLMHLANFNSFRLSSNKDIYLSILPLAHVFSRQINFIMMAMGIDIFYLNEMSLLSKICQELRPSFMIVVPRILEKMYAAILSGADTGGRLHKKILFWSFEYADHGENSWLSRTIIRPWIDWFVFSHIRKAMGGNWKVILCGGAALDPKVYQFLLNIGLPIYEGWGLTEASTGVVNQPGKIKVGTVGVPLPGIEVKVGKGGELLIRGPTVMQGYFRNAEITKESLDEEKWLHTADKGEIDAEGFVKIVGRIKEHVKLATGEWLAPGRMEYALCESPLIDAAVVIGERKKFASCLLFPDVTVLRRMKAKLNYVDMSDQDFMESEVATKEIKSLIESVNSNINNWEKIQKYRIIMEPLTLENGELTPTLKIRRDVVINKYQDLVKDMYGE
jgi:long-chain acyl-CoA synthetase